jgi:signal transduction histidine kinase
VSGVPSVHELYEPHLGRYLEIRAIPRIEPGGKMAGLIHVVRDITERKRAEEEKAKLEARLREAQKMEVIGSLAGGVAHEVRNPLNAIMALTDALDREVGGNPEYKTFMMHMRTQVDRLTTLMNDLLELGKPVEQSKLRTESLTEIVAISVDAWKQSKFGLGREVTKVLEGSAEGTYILADAKKLQQVFINLLDNAAQHSPDGSPVRIEVPPCFSMMCFTMDRPRPVPPRRVVKKVSKTRGRISAGMPAPWSTTRTSAFPAAGGGTSMRTGEPSGLCCAALSRRLMNTCWSFFASARM